MPHDDPITAAREIAILVAEQANKLPTIQKRFAYIDKFFAGMSGDAVGLVKVQTKLLVTDSHSC